MLLQDATCHISPSRVQIEIIKFSNKVINKYVGLPNKFPTLLDFFSLFVYCEQEVTILVLVY